MLPDELYYDVGEFLDMWLREGGILTPRAHILRKTTC